MMMMGQASLTLIWFSCYMFMTEGVRATTWHVTHDGSNNDHCREAESPCRTLSHAISMAGDGDEIILSSSQEDYIFEECDNTILTKSLVISGYGRQPVIGCLNSKSIPDGYINQIFTVGLSPDSSNSSSIHITFRNINLSNGYIYITNGEVVLDHCVLHHAAVRAVPGCWYASLEVSNSNMFVSSPSVKQEQYDIYDTSLICNHTYGYLVNTTARDLNINFIGLLSCHVVVKDSYFTKDLEIETDLGGVNISMPYENGSLLVQNSTFEKQIHYDPILSSINIEASTLRVETFRNNGHKLEHGASITIANSVFRDNERAVSISRGFQNITVSGCRFERNTAMHAAAAIRLAVEDDNYALIKDCIFNSNAAGFNKHESIPGTFEYDGFQVRITDEKVNGIISMVGKGGAVRIHRGIIVFVNCSFYNNSATLLGGALFVAKNGTVELRDSYFENTFIGSHSMQGDVLYSSGSVVLVNCTFKMKTAIDHVSMIRHSGNPWSLSVKSLWFECPVGHKLSMVNNTSHRVEPNIGLMRSNELDQMYYYCQTCGNNQYSVDTGYVNYTLTSEIKQFFTLLINGEQPFESHPVEYTFGSITCRECPYGGDCENDIRSVANFWGYVNEDRIAFQHCPVDYCCLSPSCTGIKTCAENRHGRLCGHCKDGYSEALFSESCVPNDTCKKHWVWAVLAVLGVIYTIFLITQKDISNFLGVWNFNFNSLFVCTKTNPEISSVPKELRTKRSMAIKDKDHENGYANDRLLSNQATDAVRPEQLFNTKSENASGGTLIILFYYFQDALLLHVDTIYTKTVSRFVKKLKAFLVGLFRFRLDFFQFMDDICTIPNLQPVQKLLLKTLFVPYVLLLLGFVFAMYILLKNLIKLFSSKRKEVPIEATAHVDASTEEGITSFSCRMTSGFILAVLFTYQKMATATFALLNCVPVGNVSVLYIDGTIECYQVWQYYVMMYAFACVVPFCIVLIAGPALLKHRSITVFDFCLGCLVPLPCLLYWVYKYTCQKQVNTTIKSEAATIIEILQGPFKESRSKHLVGQYCWAGVLVARRLILFLCYTFINDVLVRLLCMLCICFIILMHHMYVRPYKIQRANLAGAFSAAALLVVGTINLLRACFEAAEYIPLGPYKFLMEVCEEIENTLVLWLPLCGVCLVLLACIFRLMSFMVGLCKKQPHPVLETCE